MDVGRVESEDSGLWVIGSLAVRIRGELPPALKGLRRLPAGPGTLPDVELAIEVVRARTWELGINGAGHSWRKCLSAHSIEVDLQARRIVLHVVSGDLSRGSRYSLFRDVFCFLGALSGDMLAHAAAIVHEGEAILLCGLAGAGKSTIASMFAGGSEVISDEINWVCGAGTDGITVVNQPFWCPEGQPAELPALPLRAVYLLEKAGECSVGSVSLAEAFPVLLAAPFGGGDPMLRARCEATAQCALAVPLRKLRFSLDAEAVRRLVLGDARGA